MQDPIKEQIRSSFWNRSRSYVASGSTVIMTVVLTAAWLNTSPAVQGDAGSGAARASGSLAAVRSAAPVDLSDQFTRDIWPLLNKKGASCVACHTARNPSQLHLKPDAVSTYRQLLAEGRFIPGSPTSLLARVSAQDASLRMPPAGLPAWSATDIATLRTFMTAVAATAVDSADSHADEVFPAALLLPYTGPRAAIGEDNSLLSYYQLRHKIATLFGDDWYRNGKDQYLENLAQLGGADFVTRFDESSRATPSYLSAIGALAADVASRAYINRTGPFANCADNIPLPGSGHDSLVRGQIARLYQHLLFRGPSTIETAAAMKLLRVVGDAPVPSPVETGPLMFQVLVHSDDGQQGVAQTSVAVLPSGAGVSTIYVNENAAGISEQSLGTWDLKARLPNQRLVVANDGTVGHVTFKSIVLRGPFPDKTETPIASNDSAISLEGSWNSFGDGAKDGYSDGGNDKGQSRLTVPLRPARPGKYEIIFKWRTSEPGVNAENVPIAVYTEGKSNLTLAPPTPAPPVGQASYFLDQTVDTVPSWDAPAAFEFDPNQPKSGVEITNRDTRKRVVADAVSFIAQNPIGNVPDLVARADDALGHEKWTIFKPTDFTPYNTVGPDLLSDNNANKGNLNLLFPSSVAMPVGQYYHLRVTYPGHVDNDSHVPVTVYASKSSPIIDLRAPIEAPVGATFAMDASDSYNVQHSALSYTWTQIGGPRAQLLGIHNSRVEVKVLPANGTQRAWEGLCQALIMHPDFLFTRPRSLSYQTNPRVRRHLQLVKIAQDLVGRPPTVSEIVELDKGATLPSMVDRYLASKEFDDFYYRRVRLYLESHGTPTQDEPARLWKYILETGRPYTELLTADYTITPSGQRVQRPSYCGHSGVLSMPGFIEGKPGLPHFNYAAQVCEKFLGYVFEVTPAVVKARGTLTAASTVDPTSICYGCHQVLTPLAYQRTRWTDNGVYRVKDTAGYPIDDSDRHAVANYPFKGEGLQAFALAAQRKERFHRAIIQTHFVWYFGRQMRYDSDERALYHRLWNEVHRTNFALKPLVRALVTSPEYLGPQNLSSNNTRFAARKNRSPV